MQKICALARCGAQFETRDRNARFCCHPHYAESRGKPLASCEHCGGPFRCTHTGHRFCSTDCALDHRRSPKKPCETCGGLFKPARRSQRFCSRPCQPRRRLVLPLDDIRADYARGTQVQVIAEKYGFDLPTIYRHMDWEGRRWTRP
jgi:hypothetical protein